MDTGPGSRAQESLAQSAASPTSYASREALQFAHVQEGEEQGQVLVEWRREERLEALSS